MSVEFGGGSAEAWSAGQAPQDADRQVITNLYDTYAAHLFDYCVTVLQDPAAAADAVQDTLIAADAQIGKLRDPERLRVWLYCIARRQCLSDLPRGSETITPDEIFAGYRVTIDADTSDFEFPDVDSEALARETLLVVTAALRGLSGDDQEVVSLAYRHGLGGADLATVLGISGRRAAALLSGASMRFEESADAVTVLRAGPGTCPVLETIAGKWDPAAPRLTPELRRRLTRHISSCDDCSRSRGDIFGPELLGAVPLAVLPAEFREQVTRTVFTTEPGSYRRSVVRRAGMLGDDGFPVQAQGRSNLPKVMAASAALVVLIVGGVMFHELTSASAVGSGSTAAAAATMSPTSAPAGTSSSVPPVRKTHKRHSPTAFPGQLGPAPGPTSVMPVPPLSPSPSPTHSKKPSPSPSHSKKPSPSPTRTTPAPAPTTPTPTPTTPTPTPTTTTPAPSP